MRSRFVLSTRFVPRDLTEPSRFPGKGISDSRSWLGLGASIHGETLFERSSGSGCGVGDGRSHVPGDGGVVRRERCQRSEVVAAFPGDGERGGVLDGRTSPSDMGRRARLAAGAARREAGPNLAGGGGRAGRAWRSGELRRGLAVAQGGGDYGQKKACSPPSRIAPTWLAGGSGGRSIRADLIPVAWSSSTRPGPRPTCPAATGARCAAGAWWPRCRTGAGGR